MSCPSINVIFSHFLLILHAESLDILWSVEHQSIHMHEPLSMTSMSRKNGQK